MAKSQFDRLVESLSTSERKDMLRKIEETYPVSSEPLLEAEVEEEVRDVDPIEYYYHSDFLTRILVFIVSLFTGRDKGDVIMDTFISRARRQVQRDYSLYFNLDRNLGLPPFYRLLENLNNALVAFKEPLFKAMDEKIDFYIFLTNRVLGKREEEIYKETDPYEVEKNNPDFSVNQIHKKIDENYEIIIKGLDEERQRKLMLYSIIFRQLHGLASFDFEKILRAFATLPSGEITDCDLDKIKTPLRTLNNILSSFQQPPDITLLQAVFLFSHRDELAGGSAENLEEKLQMEIGSAVECLNSIRTFNKKIPLTDLIRILVRDMNYHPDRIGGGEGALRHYKSYLKNRISENFRLYINDKKRRDLIKTLTATWGISFIEPMVGYRGASFDSGFRFTYESSLSALDCFINKILQDKYYNPLNIIHINGDFYRRDNRAEFTETYDKLQTLPGAIRNFATSFLSDGSYSRSLNNQLKDTDVSLDENEEFIKTVMRSDREASNLLNFSLEVTSSLSSLLKGIIMGTGGAYDTLSNYSELGGSRNREFKNDIVSLEFLVSNFNKSLIELVSLEEKSAQAN